MMSVVYEFLHGVLQKSHTTVVVDAIASKSIFTLFVQEIARPRVQFVINRYE